MEGGLVGEGTYGMAEGEGNRRGCLGGGRAGGLVRVSDGSLLMTQRRVGGVSHLHGWLNPSGLQPEPGEEKLLPADGVAEADETNRGRGRGGDTGKVGAGGNKE